MQHKKILNFWRRFAIDISSLQQLLITFYLFLSIKNPTKFINLQNKNIINGIVLAKCVFVALVNIPFLFYEIKSTTELHLDTYASTQICYASVDLFAVAILSSIVVRYLVPLLGMVWLNVAMMRHFNERRRLFFRNERNKKPRNFILSIIIINALFFLLYLPWCLVYLIIIASNYADNTNIFVEYSASNVFIIFMFNICQSLSYINYETTFFVHVIFNKLFRFEVLVRLRPVLKLFNFKFDTSFVNSSKNVTSAVRNSPNL